MINEKNNIVLHLCKSQLFALTESSICCCIQSVEICCFGENMQRKFRYAITKRRSISITSSDHRRYSSSTLHQNSNHGISQSAVQ